MDREVVNPRVLVWARETAGLDLATAARKLGLSSGKSVSAVEKLECFESGQKEPSDALLAKMSQQYHRPLLSFYLAEPPRTGERGSDFRTLPEDQRREDAPTIDALVRNVRSRQSLVRSVLEDDEDVKPLGFVASETMKTPPLELADIIIQSIAFDRATFRKGEIDDAFRYLRSCVEGAGVYVLLLGNLGTHHTNIDPKVFRGFAISDAIAPFVVINDQDARAAWSFTLLHELAHIWLGQSGISGGPIESGIEKYCNDVATAILLSEDEIDADSFADEADLISFAGKVARNANVSRALVFYRLFRRGTISEKVWRSVTDRIFQEWREDRKRQKEESKIRRSDKPGGPNYYVVQRFHLGNALISLVRRSISNGELSPTRAGQVLGVKATSVYQLVNISERGAA
ncbi:Zn-dependent peptidase ImmA (M78 family) [Rhodanobacter sp. K2T2]|uniref:XRE family transcriptional regulator n=1 Tax=Rhodanobacter sp. K2T2 TaxID=2723085 RepID=UPI0015CC1C51|nr:XRE family transcriptional regulator [Rhodanobacter sp. K2T2]NYE31202.1 Zn-dependent peptidase ImmA (M78 family) [Rhodanobacter sp. K2T2]